MPKSSRRPQVETVSRLLNIWTQRYRPDFSDLGGSALSITVGEIDQSLSGSGRQTISAKLNHQAVMDACKLAAIRTKDLYAHSEEWDPKEVINLANLTSPVYLRLIDLYQTHPPRLAVSPKQLESLSPENLGIAFQVNLMAWVDTLEPFLSEFRLRGMITDKWKTLGFMTTQVNFTNALLLQQLDPVEQTLIHPYFKFLEEQIVMPWQRLCAIAARYDLAAPEFGVVERMLPLATEISRVTHTHWVQAFPYYYGRRGRLEEPHVRHSSLRDFTMFQVYLWLSLLKGRAKVVETELVVLCRHVYGETGIPWEMTLKGTKLLVEKVLDCLVPHELQLVSPYTSAMVKAFTGSDNALLDTPQALETLVKPGYSS